MGILHVACETGKVSDGFHTFDELYEHRSYLFILLMLNNPEISWIAKKHNDGTMYKGYFVAGMDLPTGTVTYHFPESMWKLMRSIKKFLIAPEWDGHTPSDVVKRLKEWIEMEGK